MKKKIFSWWYLHSGRSKKSEEMLRLMSIGKGPSIADAVTNEKETPEKLVGVSEDGLIKVKRVGAYSVKE
ncbi:MAG: hypothetical protein WD824_02705 [Cyclobacteriaceae bacterium]